jgi:hypothetical protein
MMGKYHSERVRMKGKNAGTKTSNVGSHLTAVIECSNRNLLNCPRQRSTKISVSNMQLWKMATTLPFYHLTHPHWNGRKSSIDTSKLRLPFIFVKRFFRQLVEFRHFPSLPSQAIKVSIICMTIPASAPDAEA